LAPGSAARPHIVRPSTSTVQWCVGVAASALRQPQRLPRRRPRPRSLALYRPAPQLVDLGSSKANAPQRCRRPRREFATRLADSSPRRRGFRPLCAAPQARAASSWPAGPLRALRSRAAVGCYSRWDLSNEPKELSSPRQHVCQGRVGRPGGRGSGARVSGLHLHAKPKNRLALHREEPSSLQT